MKCYPIGYCSYKCSQMRRHTIDYKIHDHMSYFLSRSLRCCTQHFYGIHGIGLQWCSKELNSDDIPHIFNEYSNWRHIRVSSHFSAGTICQQTICTRYRSAVLLANSCAVKLPAWRKRALRWPNKMPFQTNVRKKTVWQSAIQAAERRHRGSRFTSPWLSLLHKNARFISENTL